MQKLTIGNTEFTVKLAQLRGAFSDRGEHSFCWGVDIEASGRYYDEEYAVTDSEYNGEHCDVSLESGDDLFSDIHSWKELAGKIAVWDDFDRENGIDSGQCFFLYHQPISSAKLEIIERRGNKFYVRYSGIVDELPDKNFTFEGEMDCVIEAYTYDIRNVEELMPALSKYINIKELKLRNEDTGANDCVWCFDPVSTT